MNTNIKSHKQKSFMLIAFAGAFMLPSMLGASPLNPIDPHDIPSVLSIKSIEEFIRIDNKSKGIEKGGIYTLESNPNLRFLIKEMDKKSVICDFVAAYILRTIIGDRAPHNYIVRMYDGNIALASLFIKDFVSIEAYEDEQYKNDQIIAQFKDRKCKAWNLDLPKCATVKNHKAYRQVHFSKEATESNLLGDFINQSDYHAGNTGFIIRNGTIVDSALIDFNYALLNTQQSNHPSPNYYAGIDAALESLTLISSFDMRFLDRLIPLFNEIDAISTLYEIKSLMQKKLTDIHIQKKACELTKKIMTGNYTEETFNELMINLEKNNKVLGYLNLETKENILINNLCEKNDIAHILRILSFNRDYSFYFVTYCIKNNQYKLLQEVTTQMGVPSERIIQALLAQSQTKEQVNVALTLMEKTNSCPEFYKIIKQFLDNDIHGLIKELDDRFNNRYFIDNTHLLAKKLITIWLQYHKTSEISDSYDRKTIADSAIDAELLNEDNTRALKNLISGYDCSQNFCSDMRANLFYFFILHGNLELFQENLEKVKTQEELTSLRSQTDWTCSRSVQCTQFPEYKQRINDIFNAVESKFTSTKAHSPHGETSKPQKSDTPQSSKKFGCTYQYESCLCPQTGDLSTCDFGSRAPGLYCHCSSQAKPLHNTFNDEKAFKTGKQQDAHINEEAKPKPIPGLTIDVLIAPATDALQVKFGDQVRIRYSAWRKENNRKGRIFDQNTAYSFKVGDHRIAGLNEALLTMKVGQKNRFELAPQLMRGYNGNPSDMPKTTLIYEIELLAIL